MEMLGGKTVRYPALPVGMSRRKPAVLNTGYAVLVEKVGHFLEKVGLFWKMPGFFPVGQV